MTKIMTSIIAFDLIKSEIFHYKINSLSRKSMEIIHLWIFIYVYYVGDEVSVENLLRGIIIASGNDVVLLAEVLQVLKKNLQF